MLAPNAALRSQIVPGDLGHATAPADAHGDEPSASKQARLSWAQLLKRVFEIDMAACPQCGGPLTLLAAIGDPTVIVKILAHLGLPTRAPPRALARLDEFLQTAKSGSYGMYGSALFHLAPCNVRLPRSDACRPALWVDALMIRRALFARSELARSPMTCVLLIK